MATATTPTKPATNLPATRPGNGNVPAKAGPIDTLRNLLERSRGQLVMALPRHLTPDRMIRVAITAVQNTPGLLECTSLTIVGCVMQAAELGLELSGPLGQAYMIPRKSKSTGQMHATFQVGWRGICKLAYNSGLVSTISAAVVHDGDEFTVWRGTRSGIRHVEKLVGRPPYNSATREGIIAAYAVAQLKDGTSDFEVMTADDIDAHRKRYSRDTRADSAWNTAWPEQAKKTVIRRLGKRIPQSPQLMAALAIAEPVAERPQQLPPPGVTLDVPALTEGNGEYVDEAGEVIDHAPADGQPTQPDVPPAPATAEQHAGLNQLLADTDTPMKAWRSHLKATFGHAEPMELTAANAAKEIARLQAIAHDLKNAPAGDARE